MLKCVLAISFLTVSVTAYSQGAPDAVCSDLTPQHHVDAQKSIAPYKIIMSGNVKGGERIKLSLQGINTDAVIKGFVVQARVNSTPVGKMIPGKNSQILKCGGSENSLTHSKIESNINKVDFEWLAPNDIAGKKIDFTATIVQRGDIFWVAKSLLTKTAI